MYEFGFLVKWGQHKHRKTSMNTALKVQGKGILVDGLREKKCTKRNSGRLCNVKCTKSHGKYGVQLFPTLNQWFVKTT